MDLSGLLGAHSESASPDVLQTLVKTFADASMAAEADALCGAGCRVPLSQRGRDSGGAQP
jgi:putative transposase